MLLRTLLKIYAVGFVICGYVVCINVDFSDHSILDSAFAFLATCTIWPLIFIFDLLLNGL